MISGKPFRLDRFPSFVVLRELETNVFRCRRNNGALKNRNEAIKRYDQQIRRREADWSGLGWAISLVIYCIR